MIVHRFAWRFALVVFVASCFNLLFASKRVNPATQEPHSAPSIPAAPQQVATPGEERTSSVDSSATSGVVHSDSEETDCEHLPADHPIRLELNGRRLPLDYDGLEKGSEKRLLRASKVLPLSDGRILAGLGDTLYMLDVRKHVEWAYTPSWILWDFAVVESTRRVYGTAGDNIMFILDASNGRKLYIDGRNGKFAYGQVVPFGKDMCLITDNLEGYRDALEEWESGKIEMIETDGITAWRGTEIVWSMSFPPDAELVVRGDRICAVTKTDKNIYVREIIPPKVN